MFTSQIAFKLPYNIGTMLHQHQYQPSAKARGKCTVRRGKTKVKCSQKAMQTKDPTERKESFPQACSLAPAGKTRKQTCNRY